MLANLKIDVWGPLKGTTEDRSIKRLMYLRARYLSKMTLEFENYQK